MFYHNKNRFFLKAGRCYTVHVRNAQGPKWAGQDGVGRDELLSHPGLKSRGCCSHQGPFQGSYALVLF